MEYKIIVVGIGPGSPDYVPPIAKACIDQAKVLVGSNRALATFARKGVETKGITGRIDEALSYIANKLAEDDVVVMVSGDPGYYSLLAALRNRFGARRLSVIPGISSMQLAFARLALPWQGARLVSLHGRRPEECELAHRAGDMLGVLTDTVYTSKIIAGLLAERGWPLGAKIYLCARLSYEDEEIIETTLEEAAARQAISHCIMVVIG